MYRIPQARGGADFEVESSPHLVRLVPRLGLLRRQPPNRGKPQRLLLGGLVVADIFQPPPNIVGVLKGKTLRVVEMAEPSRRGAEPGKRGVECFKRHGVTSQPPQTHPERDHREVRTRL